MQTIRLTQWDFSLIQLKPTEGHQHSNDGNYLLGREKTKTLTIGWFGWKYQLFENLSELGISILTLKGFSLFAGRMEVLAFFLPRSVLRVTQVSSSR